MIVRRLASRRLVKSGSTEEEPRRRRAARYLLAIIIAGLLSFIAAWLGVWPFGNVQALIRTAFPNSQQLPAQSIFAPVQPTHRTVEEDDQPPPARSAPASQPTSQPKPGGTAQPRPSGSPPPDE